ncbi:hypothetical protein ACTHPF_20630 [Paenibacillus sp. SAF-054]|uniref:hypothetical protein n=1 Tax=unclassified Paenibacillus TaxID=185978 RepID=UPI003F7E3146
MRIAITTADEILVKRYILLPLILTAYERDLHIITDSGLFKSPDIYAELIEIGLKAVTEDLSSVRLAFSKRGIKVYEETHLKDGIRAEFLCRGYHGNMFLSWSLIGAEGAVLMRKYLGLDISRFGKVTVPERFRS